MKTINKPKIINLESIGSSALGYITVADGIADLPFKIERVYWTYFTPQNVIRGGHAHIRLQQLIFAVSGLIKFRVETIDGEIMEFLLDKPNIGLHLPPLTWRDIQFSHNAVLLCLASESYNEADYIREYDLFKKWS